MLFRSAKHKDILKVTAEIQTSLLNDQFIPYFQPIYNTATMQLLGFETLARWRHPTGGILPPGAFIPEAEESGLLTAIDRSIVSQALAVMESFTRKYPNLNFHLNANASGLSLKDASFFDFIEGKLKNVTFPPDRFTLEITEDVLMENLGEARGRLEKLKKLNISVALDDLLAHGRDRLCDQGILLPVAQCDAEKLPFPDDYFDCVTVAFGLRNMTHKDRALAEMRLSEQP